MTESEAIKKIEKDICKGNPKGLCKDSCMLGKGICAYEMAISALEEVQQLHAIGTVEELKTMKENGAFSAFEMAQLIAKMNKLKEYEKIGTVSEFRELKEKATGKKPIDVRYFGEAGYSIGLCPTCKSGINSEFKYCGDCCQCLDWSEGKE